MTQDEIIEMAQKCNLIGMRTHLDGIYSEALVAFAKLVAAKATDDFFRMIADRNPKPFSSLQRTWVGLTEEEIEQAIELISMLHGDYATEVAYAIEAKLKEKNT